MAIAYDATAVGLVSGGSSPLTFPHTCTGSDLLLWVGVFSGGGDTITGVTYNGVSMTQAIKMANSIGEELYLYYLAGPSTNTNNVVISWTGTNTVRGSSASYTGCSQTSIPDATTSQVGPSTSLTTTLTTTADNCWTIVEGRGAGTLGAGAGTTIRGTADTSNVADSSAAITPAGSTSLTLTQGVGVYGMVMASFAPVATATATAPIPSLTLLGVGV